MKSVVILFADSPAMLTLASELQLFLQQTNQIQSTELWLFYATEKPQTLPDFGYAWQHVLLVKTVANAPAEILLPQLLKLQQQRNSDLLLFSGDALGGELATRLAFRLQGSSAIHAEKLHIEKHNIEKSSVKNGSIEKTNINKMDENRVTIIRSVCGNNLQATLTLTQAPYCLSPTRRTAHPCTTQPLDQYTIEWVEEAIQPVDWLLEQTGSEQSDDNHAQQADIVLVIGQGVAPAAIAQWQQLAQQWGAYFAVSRPVAMNGLAPMHRVVGVSGMRLAPKLCIVVGASGSPAFMAGVEDSEMLIAINHDPDARIIQLADAVMIEDLATVLPALENQVQQSANKT